MAPYNYKTIVGPWEGVDYRPNDLERSDNAAADMLNVHVTPDNLLTQRPGTILSGYSPTGSPGIAVLGTAFPLLQGYIPVSSPAAALTSVGAAFTGGAGGGFSIACTDTGTLAIGGLSVNTGPYAKFDANFLDGQFHLQIIDSSGAITKDIPCGTGKETSIVYSVAQLNTQLQNSAIGQVSLSLTDPATVPCQAVGPFDTRELSSSVGVYKRVFPVWNATLIMGATAANATFRGGPATSKFVNISDSVTWNGTTTYFTLYGNLYAYDGVRAYTPGVPAYLGATFSFDTATAGNVDIGTHLYGFQLRYYDANGGFVDGPMITNANEAFSDLTKGWTATVSGSTKEVKITYAAAGDFGSIGSSLAFSQPPYLTDVTNGGGSSSVTSFIPFATESKFGAGDQVIAAAYNAGGDFISTVNMARVSQGGTTITLDGPGITYRAGATLSRNITLLVWRQKLIGTEYNLVGEVPFNPAGATVIDNTADANLGEAYVEPVYVQGTVSLGGFNQDSTSEVLFGNPLPLFNCVTVYDNLLIAASNNTVFYTLPDNLSNWSADQNSFLLPLKSGEEIVAIKGFGGVLYIWATNSLYQVTGTLPQPGIPGTFQLSKISESVGCVSLKSVAIVEDKLAWLAADGLYSLTPGAYPSPVDSTLRPLYVGKGHSAATSDTLYFNFAVYDFGNASYDPYRRLYICSFTLQGPATNVIALKLVWNVDQGGLWEIWSDLDTTQGNIYVPGLGTLLVGLGNSLYRFSDNEAFYPERYQAADNELPIPFSYTGSWESMGAPSIAKNYTRFRLLSGTGSQGSEQHFTLNVNLQKDYSLGSAGSKLLDFGSTTGFGLEPYGMAPYGDPTKSGLNMKPLNSKARAMRPIFTHNKLYEKIKIMGWEYELSPDFKQNKGNK